MAAELLKISPNLFVWQAYDASVKADLSSSALETDSGLFLVDPIPLAKAGWDQLLNRAIAGIIITNANHHRDAAAAAAKVSVPIFAHAEAQAPALPGFRPLEDRQSVARDLDVIALKGVAPGEIALYHKRDGGTMIMGDALINFDPHGFSFLPGKYCSNPKEMHRSLLRLLDFEFNRMVFAHGTPIITSGRQRFAGLLARGR